MVLLPNIRYGTERYPEKVARRLRAVNIGTWMAAALTAGFAIFQFLNLTPGLWKAVAINTTAAIAFAATPLLHRVGPLAAPLTFVLVAYIAVFSVCALIGTGTGMQFYFLTATAMCVLFLGVEHILQSLFLAVMAAFLVIALEMFVPRNTDLQAPEIVWGSFIATTFASLAILFAIVFYAIREVGRAEAIAEREYERSESLLANILPASIAVRLKNHSEVVIADKYEAASVLFADMAGFTARAGDMAPDQLVEFLNRVFTRFDRLVDMHGLEKIKTSGDAYMVVSGVPQLRPDHAEALAGLAIAMRDCADELGDLLGPGVQIRIGMASGPVVAGVVGTRKFFFDVWGDAVNVASRMESTGVPGKIQVSESFYGQVKNAFAFEERGQIEIKGKGTMRTWFLLAPEGSGSKPPDQHNNGS